MPLGPLRIACVQPAPKSHLVVSGLSRTRATRAGANAPRFLGLCIRFQHSTPTGTASTCVETIRDISAAALLLLLLFDLNGPDTTKRDLGAGRTQAARSGPSGMDAARAAPGHGWPMAAGPRSVAGVRVRRRRSRQTGSLTLGCLLKQRGGSFQVTRRRRNSLAVRPNLKCQYHQNYPKSPLSHRRHSPHLTNQNRQFCGTECSPTEHETFFTPSK
ncbi:hypothetical protein SAMN03159444_02869 [Pseudomonas sp. NFACC02]|nr:hypothetical protein SAMN03159444_02869 [Pseudomonas sp. NFACC02]